MTATEPNTASPSQREKVFTFIGTALVCIIASFVPQQLYVASRADFGAGDVSAFLFWGAPFALMLGAFAPGFVAVVRRIPAVLRYLLALIVGAGSGILWTIFVRAILGPWFGAFSFPVIYFWMFGGFSGLLFASLYAIRRNA
ncbi:MAG: hypothetical protein O3B01_04670 [Planctomycetota bacterium]|nr:hypothetical protein [Planctomycetota bacterium]MDA1137855.1 hypothetical protein [Planctomycetota bacterium]